MIYLALMAACWLAFALVWAVSLTKAKRDAVRYGSMWLSIGARLLVVVAIVLLLRWPATRQLLRQYINPSLIRPTIRAIGNVLCAAGIAIAIWARIVLAANWSWQPATKADHELITSGPYRLVRHPIYSGMLLAILGTSLVSGIPGLIVFVCFGFVVGYRISVEERLMQQLFAARYLEYKKRTKALIPCLV